MSEIKRTSCVFDLSDSTEGLPVSSPVAPEVMKINL